MHDDIINSNFKDWFVIMFLLHTVGCSIMSSFWFTLLLYCIIGHKCCFIVCCCIYILIKTYKHAVKLFIITKSYLREYYGQTETSSSQKQGSVSENYKCTNTAYQHN